MKNRIECPNCSHEFDVEDVLSDQVESRMKIEFAEQLKAKDNEYKTKQAELDAKAEQIRKDKEAQQEELEKLIANEKINISAKMEAKIKADYDLQLNELKKERDEKNAEIKEVQKKELNLIKQANQLQLDKEAMELQVQKKLEGERNSLIEELRKKEEERTEMQINEYKKKLEDQKNLVEEMKRKGEQGSMQLQGEVMELAIEEVLMNTFVHDRIEEVKKGQRGADAIQYVINPQGMECGSIIYESKRAQAFSKGWIEKLKADQRDKSADIAVLVTATMPKGMDRFGMYEGVFVCSFHELKGLAIALRDGLLRVGLQIASNQGKGTKMEYLYEYMTGVEFKQRVEAIVEGFTLLKDQLETEKRVFTKQWKEREKQIDKVMSSTIELYGAVKGIAGSSVQTIASLELDAGTDELDN
jgi:hypothetical protein